MFAAKIAKHGFKAKNRLADTVAVDIGITLLQCSPLKPVFVNRALQNILRHPQSFQLRGSEESSRRDLIICFIAALFRLHPTNTCQPSHVIPLMRIYGGTISASDRNLLNIFRLYEAEKLTPILSILAKWSPFPRFRTCKKSSSRFFNLLKNLIKPSSDGPPSRLPSYVTLILSHALRGVLSFKFHLLTHGTFLSSAPRTRRDRCANTIRHALRQFGIDDWKRERGWIVRFLSDGAMSTEDGKVLKRRHPSSLVQSSVLDKALRRAVLEVCGANTFVYP
ncbi:hypothetical protein CY34DRAFT_16859 [Suillus luteus UH-Slu-Lm8-n1]|uniref:URB1 C-terminal domain-containing protein n=1 Tax=Suillus luteus UH-Slu-Lm8-n1 TaxID=930992 RepID=A0A0D0AV01_9AGAM|nr:hypothetical protein CY34DRAFT_16859 [Suillus luteus UH-Slu-Lm8-n1]